MGMLITMAEDTKKKTKAKTFVKHILRFFKKDDRKEKDKQPGTHTEEKHEKKVPIVSPAARFREKIEKLDCEQSREEHLKEIDDELVDTDDEDLNDKKNERLDSQTSQDSGFIEKDEESVEGDVADILSNLKIDENEENTKETENNENSQEQCTKLADALDKLKLEEGKCKKDKKVRTVTISRTPIVNKNVTSRTQAHPYAKQTTQVKVVNPHTLSGGQVIEVDEFQDIVHTALKDLLKSSKKHENELDEDETFSIINDLITNDQNDNAIQPLFHYQADLTYEQRLEEYQAIPTVYSEIPPVDILGEFGITPSTPNIIETSPMISITPENGADQLINTTNCQQTSAMTCPEEFMPLFEEQSVYMTPPRSVNMASPLSEFQPSPRAHTSSSDYTFSPSDRSSPVFNSDMETYQKIPQFESQSPSRESEVTEKKTNLKQFKSMQKEIAASFSDKECCQKNRKSCKDIFNERLMKFSPEERKNICMYVCKMDLNDAFGLLQVIMLRISNGSDKEDLDYVMFSQICGRLLGEQPDWFHGEFGLTLIELAAMRCHSHPVLTRLLVECVRAVKLPEGHDANDCLFRKRVDARRDNLVLACVRKGDSRAAALHWLVRRQPHQPPLFDLSHVNTEGYSALHVACKAHGPANPMLHTVHVLLHHGHADLWKGDLKGGDTALHLAVSSPTCDLRMVLLLFHQEDQKRWKQLAHCNNLGSVTPIEYARCAVKSSAKQNFPIEVLEFMKKLR